MNKFRFTINVLAIATFMFAFASMAQAQATRTWVSGVGDDANPAAARPPARLSRARFPRPLVMAKSTVSTKAAWEPFFLTKSNSFWKAPMAVRIGCRSKWHHGSEY